MSLSGSIPTIPYSDAAESGYIYYLRDCSTKVKYIARKGIPAPLGTLTGTQTGMAFFYGAIPPALLLWQRFGQVAERPLQPVALLFRLVHANEDEHDHSDKEKGNQGENAQASAAGELADQREGDGPPDG